MHTLSYLQSRTKSIILQWGNDLQQLHAQQMHAVFSKSNTIHSGYRKNVQLPWAAISFQVTAAPAISSYM